MSLWTVGHDASSVCSSPALGGTSEVAAFGSCLATVEELREACDAAERGSWALAARLPGSYVAVVRSGSTVRVIGDRAGVHVVFWLRDGGEVVWSTSALMLAARRGSGPDTARLLSGLALHGVDHLGDHSYVEGVHRVPPGQALVLEPGRAPRTEDVPRRYGQLSRQDGALALADHLETAVRRRIDHSCPVSSDLSGGVDSGAITSLAAAHRGLLAVTYTDRVLADQDDVHYARRIAASFETITHAEIHGHQQGVGHFDGLDDLESLPVTDAPSLTLGLLAIKRAQLAPALAYGSRLHLTGRGGDNVLDSIPMSLIDLARSGGLRTATGRLYAFARDRRAAVHEVLLQAARTARTSSRRALAGLAADLGQRTPSGGRAYLQPRELLAWCGPLPAAGWLTVSGRRAVAGVLERAAQTADLTLLPGTEHERIALHRMGEEHATYDDIARQKWGLPVHAPYLDGPVVDACLAVPGWQRWGPGDFKPLARTALTGAVPDVLLQRRTKTPMTGSVHLGLRANLTTLRAVIAGSRLASAGLLDPVPVLAALDSAARGAPAPLGSLHHLIVTELWLARLPNRRALVWEPVPAARGAA